MDLEPVTQSPKWIASNARFLTASPEGPRDAHGIVRDFIDGNREVFGHGSESLDRARLVTDYSTERGPSRKVVWHQEHEGIEIFEAVLQANLTPRLEIINIGSQFMAEPETAVNGPTAPVLTVEHGVALAGQNVGEKVTAAGVKAMGPAEPKAHRRQQFRAAMLTDADARLTWLPLNEKTMRLTWDVTLTSRSRGEMYRVLVDAENGAVLLRQAMTAYISDATYRVFTAESPTPMSPGHETPSSLQAAPVSRVLVTTPALNTTASPNGWINDGDNITSGNNADAYTDTNADNVADLPRTTGTGRVFDFPYDLTQEPAVLKDASVTQLFYWTNFMHDRMYELGFTEAAGNFQMDNFGRGGIGNDPVNSEAQDGSGTNNANFSTPVDGGRGRMQMFNWTSPEPDRDGSFEAEVVLHEYGHGVSNRLVGGPSVTISALSSRGMGEGWSDFYGLALIAEASDNPHGNWARGAWSRYLSSGWFSENYYYGARRYSYSTDMLKNPHTLKDIDPTQVDWHTSVPRNPTYAATQDATQVHYQGTVWCVTLWDLRANLILKHGFATGNERAIFLVTEGMKYSPANPSFIQARDGILQATLVNHSGDLGEVWTAFAKRGMGDGASAPASSTTTGIVESYTVPDSLEISDRGGWNIEGNRGGPFAPATKTLTLSNDGAATVNWSTNSVPWLSVSPASGTLAAGANVTVTVTPQADTVEPGFHSANLVFTNTGTSFSQPVGIRLYVTPPVAASFDLSLNPGWTTSGEWAYGTPAGGGGSAAGGAGNADPASGATGGSVYGVNLAGNASAAAGGPFYLTSTPVNLSARKTTRLRFKRWLNTGALSATRCTVEVSTDGTTWREVFVNPGSAITDNAWRTMEYDISSIADGQAAVQVRWSYRNVTASTAYSGWNIDDVEFLGEPTSQFTLDMAESVPESAGTITGTLNLNLPQDAPVTVTLSSSDPTAATVPATLSLATGEVTKNFTITLVDDPDLDGTQTTVITASAPFIGTGTRSLAVTDDETATLTLTAPASVTEGASGISGSLTVSTAPTRDIRVPLMASLPALSVPASVTIPSGSAGPVFFTFDAPDNAFAEGVKNVTLTAAVPGWTSGMATVAVNDDESPTIVLTGPDTAREGDGPQSFTATVNTIQAADLTLSLVSADMSELTVPATVVIPAGQFSASFDAAPQDDAEADGVQTALITASAAGYTSGTKSVSIADNEADHYTWAVIASPQKRNKPFDITLTARDINGAVITNHGGSVTLVSASPGGPPPFTPGAVTGFINGSASTQVVVTAAATAMTLTATDAGGKTGTSNAFDVEPVAHDTFVFSGMPASASADTLFNATATAVDDLGGTVTSYTVATVVDILGSYFDRTVGSTTTATGTDKVHNTAAHDSRTQIIYTAAELGGAPKLISALAVSRLTTGGQAMLNYKIRLKHTTLDRFDGRSWEETGWTTVYTSASFAASGSLHTFNLKPFAYDGVRNLMVDISFDNASASTAGTLRQTPAATNRMLSGTSASAHGDPTTWTAASGPMPVISNELPTLQFNEARSFGPIPASPAAFAAGVWSGQAAAPIAGSMWLRATAPSGVTGLSNLISISNPATTVGADTVFSDGFESGLLGASWSTAGSGATARTQVTAANTPKTGAYHLTMDTTSTATGTFATNRPTLTLNLAGRKNVSLEWFAKSFADEATSPTLTGPLGTFDSTMNYDGVAISQDGANWVEVSALRFLSSSYGATATRVFLDPVIQRLGWSFNSTFLLRFSQYDDQAIPNDGIGLDDIAVRANPVNAIAVSLPPTIAEGALNQAVTVTLPAAAASNTTVGLISNAPARLSIVSPVIILAGQTSASTTISAPQNHFADVGKGVIVTASATGQTTSHNHIRVVDDEQPVLTLALPDSVTEGGGNGAGTVLIDPVQPVSTPVFFTSGNTGEVTVSANATISAGARSATFTIMPVNDVLLDGTQVVSITASGQGLGAASGTVDVLDNEPLTLTVTPPATLSEGGAPGVGTVTLSGPCTVDTSIILVSSDTSEASVPGIIMIPAGQSSINFQVFPVEDSIQDGAQSVTVTASSAGFSNGIASFQVLDNDPASFEWAVVPSPQTRNAPFAVTLTARDATDNTLTSFNGSVSLAAKSGTASLPLSASASGTFVNGVWSGNLAVGAASTGVTLLATGGDGATGASEAFDVVAGGAAVALSVAPVASPHPAGTAVQVQVRAVDAAGLLVNETGGPVSVELVTSPGGVVVASASLTLVGGAASTTFQVPFGIAAARLQAASASLTGQGGVFAIQSPPPITYPPPEVVFSDGFEDPAFKPEWTITGTGTHRTIVTADNGPRTGARHMTMDSSISLSNARNEATLTLNLAGRSDVELSFWMKESGDEDHGPPTLPFTGGADFDGVAVSADGNTWYEVRGLRTADGISSTYTQFKVNLSAAAATHGLTLGSAFKIRFNHFDDYPFASDGFAFDDITVTANAYAPPEPVATLFEDDFESGVFRPQWAITGTGIHRTQITGQQAPRGGFHMLMDAHISGLFSRNEATLTLDLSGQQDVTLAFWMKEIGDEDHGPPSVPFTGGADFDGVAVSQDGVSWYLVKGLRGVDGISADYTEFTVDLSAAAAQHGLTFGPGFKIRFNHYDDFPVTSDGFAFDDIRVTGRPVQQLVLSAPATLPEGGSVMANVTLPAARAEDTVITLATNRPDGVTVPASVTIPAGNTVSADFAITAVQDAFLTGNLPFQVVAASEGFRRSVVEMIVVDNETPAGFELSLPSALAEGGTISGSVSVTSAHLFDLPVALSASPGIGLTLPSSVVLPAGATSASFDLSKPENNTILEPASTTITATLGAGSGSAHVTLTDNDASAPLVISLPASVLESAAPLAGSVGFPQPVIAGTDVTVSLISSDTTELTVPSAVVIPAGAGSISFDITPVDDALSDGAVVVTVAAAASGLTGDMREIIVLDDEVHHLAFAPVSSPQPALAALPITLRAESIDNQTVTNFTGAAALSAANAGGAVGMTPGSTGAFTAGVWTGQVTFPAPAPGVTLTANAGGGITGSSNAFDVVQGARLTVAPAPLSLSLPEGEPDTTLPLALGNPGGLTTNWNAEVIITESAAQPQLAKVLSDLNADFAAITALIPNRYDFSEGVTGTSINDGGGDMYDGGNYLSTNITAAGAYLSYSDNMIAASANLGAGGQYFTRKHPGLFVFAADIAGLNHFEISGGLGADGSGATDTAILTSARGELTYKGYVKRVYNAGDPSVNHLIIVKDDPAITRTASTDTNNDQHRLSGLGAVTRIYYLLYASSSGGYINNAQTQAIMDAFLDSITAAPWLTLASTSGSIPAGGGTVLDATFHPSGLPLGGHHATLRFTSNDPTQLQRDVPVALTITPAVNHFTWSTIPSPQTANVPFAATLTARDASNATVTSFNGSAMLQALGSAAEITTGTGTSAGSFPFSAGSYYEFRAQSIYTPAEVGAAGRIQSIALDVTALPSTLTDFTIRLKHTSKADYTASGSAVWDGTGWTTVYKSNLSVASTGWLTLPLTTFFEYDGASHLMVDFSFDNASFGASGTARYSTTTVSRTIYGGQYGGSAPVSWAGASPSAFTSTTLVNLRFSKRPVSPLAPPSVVFTNGVWSGTPSVGKAAAQTSLVATHSTQPAVTGESGLFTVTSLGSLSLTLPPAGTEGGTLNGTVTVSVAPASDLTVALATSAVSVALPPATVTILAGQTSAAFTLDLPEDTLLEGTQTVLISASAPAYDTAQAAVTVDDNDSTTITLTLPATLAEGTSSTAGQASVQLAAQAAADLTISLASSLTARLTVPASVVIPAGQSSAAFTLTAPNNSIIDGDQEVAITATLAGSAPASGTVLVTDNESRVLSFSLFTTSISEGGVPSTFAGYISVGSTVAAPLTIQLTSSDTSELNISGSVTINAGSSISGYFTLTPVNDTIFDGTQTVTLTASAATFTGATSTVSVLDDDAHHFTVSTVASPQVRNAPFNVTFTARDINNVTIITYAGSPVLSAADGASPITVSPGALTGFSSGAKTQSVNVGNDAASAVLTLTDPVTGGAGTSNAFAVGGGSLDHFAISTMPASMTAGSQVPVTITARDIGSNTVASFNQTASLAISSDSSQVTVGTGTSTWSIPLGSQSLSQRMQVIYLPSEVGAARTLHNLALNVGTVPGSSFTGYTIRMKHTAATTATASWESTGWTTVYQANTTISAAGWHQFDFSTPFAYNGTSSLMIDFSYYNASNGVSQGYMRYTSSSSSRTTLLQTDTDFGNPLTWSGAANPTPFTNFVLPNIRFGTVGVSVPVTPTVTGTFVSGVWNGTVSAASAAAGVRLRAVNGATSGASNSFEVIPPQLLVSLPATASESAGAVSGTVSLLSAQAADITISLSSDDLSEASPASPAVIIPAGTISAGFTLNIVNDSIHDGAQTAVISASAAGLGTATASIIVTDDDVHHFDVSVPPGAKIRNAPFDATFTARDVNHDVITTYAGSPALTCAEAGSPLNVSPAQIFGFVNGVRTQAVTVSSFASAAVLTLTDAAAGASGASPPFAVTFGPASVFQWDHIPSPAVSGAPFPVTIRALDSAGNTAVSYGGAAELFFPGSATDHDFGSSMSDYFVPFNSNFNMTRTQQVLRAADLNLQAGNVTALAINITVLPASKTFTNFTIRIKTTSRTGYSGTADYIWDAAGFTTVFQGSVALAGTGYRTFNFTTPFHYDGTSNLMVDYSYSSVSNTSNRPTVRGTTRSGTSSINYYTSSTSFGEPLSWSGTTPSAFPDTRTTDVRFTMSNGMAPTPPVTSAFVAGTWSGNVTVNEAGQSLTLMASSGALSGVSNMFEVHPVSFALIPEPPHTGGTSNMISWNLPVAGLEYEAQRSTTPGFEAPVSSGFGAISSTVFTGLADGQTYYYRARMRRLSPLAWTGAWSPVVSSTQDASPPVISAPSLTTISAGGTLSGTAMDAVSGVASVQVNGGPASSLDAFANWTGALAGLVDGANSISVTASDNAQPPNISNVTTVVYRIASPAADSNNDGVNSLMEHALGLPAGSADARARLPVAHVETDGVTGQKFFCFEYRRRIQRGGLSYVVETSGNLAGWDDMGADVVEQSVVPAGDGVTEKVTVRITPAMSLGGRKFVRLRVSAN